MNFFIQISRDKNKPKSALNGFTAEDLFNWYFIYYKIQKWIELLSNIINIRIVLNDIFKDTHTIVLSFVKI